MWINMKEEKMILKTTFFCHQRKTIRKGFKAMVAFGLDGC
jgi:hypothetical protein